MAYMTNYETVVGSFFFRLADNSAPSAKIASLGPGMLAQIA